jgi:uncharacterized protein YndB with AHSA1/START domain
MANAAASPEAVTFQLTRHYPVPPARVFQAWTDPEALRAWFSPNPAASMPDADVDLRVGGRYRLRIINPDGQEHCVTGEYREIVPPSKLVFSWVWNAAPDRVTQVTVEMRDDNGGTELTLTHEGLVAGTELTNHEHGWRLNIERLAEWAAR